MPVGPQFHKKVDSVGVIEEIVELDKIGMFEKQLDFNFLKKLLLHFLLTWRWQLKNISLIDDLQGSNETGFDMSESIYFYIARNTSPDCPRPNSFNNLYSLILLVNGYFSSLLY